MSFSFFQMNFQSCFGAAQLDDRDGPQSPGLHSQHPAGQGTLITAHEAISCHHPGPVVSIRFTFSTVCTVWVNALLGSTSTVTTQCPSPTSTHPGPCSLQNPALESRHTPALLGFLSQRRVDSSTTQLVSLGKGEGQPGA